MNRPRLLSWRRSRPGTRNRVIRPLSLVICKKPGTPYERYFGGERGPIDDITTAAEAEQTFNSLFQVVRRYKLNGYRIQLRNEA